MLSTMTDDVADAIIDALCEVEDWDAALSLAREADQRRRQQRQVAWLPPQST